MLVVVGPDVVAGWPATTAECAALVVPSVSDASVVVHAALSSTAAARSPVATRTPRVSQQSAVECGQRAQVVVFESSVRMWQGPIGHRFARRTT